MPYFFQPGSIYKESDCKICQCIDNLYVCDEQTCQRSQKTIVTVEKPITSQIIEESVIVKKPEKVVISTITPPAVCAPEK